MAVPVVIYKDKPLMHSWARWMVGRVMRKNNNNLISVIGKTGSGKSWTALSIAEIMSNMMEIPFTADFIVFSLIELMQLINSGKLKRGSVILFDEPQASISARDFQSDANKVFNLLVSTFRHRNLTLLFATPFESLLDKNTRRLFHGRFETLSINKKKKTCRLKPRFLEYSDFKADPYRKQMIICYKEDGVKKTDKLFYWDVPKPSDEMIELYEQKKLAFTDNLNKNIYKRLLKFEEKGKSITATHKETPKDRKPLTAIQEEVMKVVCNHTLKEASEILGKNTSAIHCSKVQALKKGYTLEEFRNAEK